MPGGEYRGECVAAVGCFAAVGDSSERAQLFQRVPLIEPADPVDVRRQVAVNSSR